MGNCCGSKSTATNTVRVRQQKKEQYKLPKIIVMPEDSALIYLDVSSTPASMQLRESLKHRFPNLVSCDNDKRIFNQINMMKRRKYYIVIVDNIRQETLRFMLADSKVRAIYFSIKQIKTDQHFKSHKIKGFFNDQMALKNAIYHDVRADDIY
ncbi:unnamed protein product [Rotaria sordida]|uniref:Uncharacterized protein n=1 Tax=Rotaria sordida TaxID=392033 RepID=A0A819F158_9BILA|nr:unnamed protein product [Rotaria sordida]CAF1341781.1 unnamed protein product [Rotaria sordida]CAF3860889.1 unnamed protein product [Rotaria sordida]CAF3887078.1 unnamed protein product [Rotaria sordida]